MPIITGGTGGGGGGLTVLSDTTLAAPAASFDITSGLTGFSQMLIICKLRDDGAVANSSGNLRFNNDSGGNYDSDSALQTNTTLVGSASTGATAFSLVRATGANSTASAFGTSQVLCPDYGGTGHKTIILSGGVIGTEGTVGTFMYQYAFGVWKNTAAINRVTITPGDGTNWVAGSRLTIYGML